MKFYLKNLHFGQFNGVLNSDLASEIKTAYNIIRERKSDPKKQNDYRNQNEYKDFKSDPNELRSFVCFNN